MTDRKPYTFVLLRYRHDVAAGEFANVGILLHQPSTGFFDVKVRTTLGPRLTKMFPKLNGDAFKRTLRTIHRATEKIASAESLFIGSGDALTFAHRIVPPDDSSVGWSDLRSGITNNASETLDKLYRRFVSQYDVKAKPFRDDAAVWRPIREMLSDRKIADHLQAKVISSDVDEVEFAHAWKNGAWHCYQPISFDLSSSEYIGTKAARWAGHMQGLETSDEEFKPYFIVGAPSDPDLLSAYRRAIELLRRSPGAPSIFEEDSTLELVNMMEDEIRAHEKIAAG